LAACEEVLYQKSDKSGGLLSFESPQDISVGQVRRSNEGHVAVFE